MTKTAPDFYRQLVESFPFDPTETQDILLLQLSNFVFDKNTFYRAIKQTHTKSQKWIKNKPIGTLVNKRANPERRTGQHSVFVDRFGPKPVFLNRFGSKSVFSWPIRFVFQDICLLFDVSQKFQSAYFWFIFDLSYFSVS